MAGNVTGANAEPLSEVMLTEDVMVGAATMAGAATVVVPYVLVDMGAAIDVVTEPVMFKFDEDPDGCKVGAAAEPTYVTEPAPLDVTEPAIVVTGAAIVVTGAAMVVIVGAAMVVTGAAIE